MRACDCKIGMKVRLLDKTVPGFRLSASYKRKTLWQQGWGLITGIQGSGSGANEYNCIEVSAIMETGGDFYRPQDLEPFAEPVIKTRSRGIRKLIV